MTNRVYYVGVGWKAFAPPPGVTYVDNILGTAGDWVRLNDWTWLCSTTLSSEEIYRRFQDYMGWLDRLVVVALDPSDRYGLAPDWVWEWIDGQRQTPPKTAASIISDKSSSRDADQGRQYRVHEAAEG